MFVLYAFLATASAAGGTWWSDDIAGSSKLFAEASDKSGKTFEDRNGKADALSTALRDYEVALDLLGARAPAAERDRLDQLEKDYNRQFAALQKFSDSVGNDFNTAFGDALGRALQKHPGATECQRMVADGPALPGMPQRTKANPECKGDDLSPVLAKEMDADPVLQKAVADLVALEWPTVALPSAAQAPVGPGDRWVSVVRLFQTGAKDALRKIDQEDEQARLPLEAAVEEGDVKQDKEKLLAEAKKIDAATAAKRASLGTPVLSAADAAMAKWAKKGEPATGWCANPALLGGCTGTDATKDVVPRLIEDKKVAAALGG